MQKIYLVMSDFDHCNNGSFRVFPTDSKLIPLGYALIAVDQEQKYAKSIICLIEDLIENQETYYVDSAEIIGILFKKEKNELILDMENYWRGRTIKIPLDNFIKLAQDFLQITKPHTPDVIELIQEDNGSFTFFYQK